MITAPAGWFAAYHDPGRGGVSLLPLVGWAMFDEDDVDVDLGTASIRQPVIEEIDTRGFPLVSRLDGRVHYAMDIHGFICVTGPGQNAFEIAEHLLHCRQHAN